MRTTLTPLRWWHINQIMPIEMELFGEEAWSAGMFWSELAQGNHYVVALDDDRSVLGYAGIAMAGSDEAWVHNVGVRRSAQRRGIGRDLVSRLLEMAVTHGAHRVFLEVAVDNAPAQKLYALYGFEPLCVRRGYYQPSNTDALVMVREEGNS